MIAAMQEAGLPEPEFEETAAGFRVTLRSAGDDLVSPQPHQQPWAHLYLNERQEKALAHVQSNGRITNSDFQLNHLGIRARRWLTRSTIAAGRNDELGINLRGGVGYGGGRAVVLSNRTNLWLSGLLSGNREYTNDGRQKNNLELVFDTNLLAFRYDNPRLELKADLSTFANLTTAGRYRVNFDGRISLELLKDFFWDVGQVYYRYDNEPSTEAESTSDYGIVTGVRYKF